MLLNHQVGLPTIDDVLPIDDVVAVEPVVKALVAARPGAGGGGLPPEIPDDIKPLLEDLMAAFFDPQSLVNRSLAKLYAATVSEVDGVRLLSPETVAAATTPQREPRPQDRLRLRHEQDEHGPGRRSTHPGPHRRGARRGGMTVGI